MLGSIATQFDEFVAGTYPTDQRDARFYVQEVRRGSIVIEFVSSVIGMMDQAIILKQFFELTAGQARAYIGLLGAPIPEPSKRQHLVDMVRAVATSEDGKLTLAFRERESDGAEAALIIGKDEAKEIVSRASEFPNLGPLPILVAGPVDGKPERVLMRLYQHNQDPKAAEKKQSAHKAIILKFSNKPRANTYETSDVARQIADILASEPYATTLFDVTAAPRMDGDKLKAFNVIELHEWFPDDDDETGELALEG